MNLTEELLGSISEAKAPALFAKFDTGYKKAFDAFRTLGDHLNNTNAMSDKKLRDVFDSLAKALRKVQDEIDDLNISKSILKGL